VVGDTCWVAGTTDAGPDGRSRHPGDIAGQARAVFDVIERALAQAGFRFDEIVRIRMFVTDMAAKDALMAVQSERFREIRPAATLVEVSALIDPSLLVEIEADARHD
jgi:enamine deaminase RidA (YjgF/YER057c/UK114 family)